MCGKRGLQVTRAPAVNQGSVLPAGAPAWRPSGAPSGIFHHRSQYCFMVACFCFVCFYVWLSYLFLLIGSGVGTFCESMLVFVFKYCVNACFVLVFCVPEIHAMLRQVFHLLLIACVVLISGSCMVVCKVTFLSCTPSVFFVVEHFD